MPFDKGRALIIGVGSYANIERWKVPTTVADAAGVDAVLRDPRFAGYGDARVTLLSNQQASRQGILDALGALSQAAEDETILLFYAGHGHYSADGAYHLTTYDTQLTPDRKIQDGTALSHAELLDRLRAIKAKRLLLIFNACHSGEVSPATLGEGEQTPFTGAPVPSIATDAILATGSGRVIITACREDQVSYIGGGERTIFGQALVDGLKGQGVNPQRGYISVFDLYSKVFFTVGDKVEQIPLATRQTYGEKQEPELTVLKGVGPFAVALYRGSTPTLGDVDESAPLPEDTATRSVAEARAKSALQAFNITNTTTTTTQSFGDNAKVGAAVGGDVGGNISSTDQSGGVNFGSGNSIGSVGKVVAGDDVAGDQNQLGDISGSSVAVGRGAQAIDAQGARGVIGQANGPVSQRFVETGGGDYSEDKIDKRSGTFNEGDQFTMSGNFQGSVLNIKSTLSNVTQSIGALPIGDQASKDELKRLLDQLNAQLQQAARSKPDEADAVAQTAKSLVEQVSAGKPNKTLLQITAEGLKSAAQSLGDVLPAVVQTAAQIAGIVMKFVP